MTTSFVTCPLCEATCGLAIKHEGGQVLGIRGDKDDVFSGGYLCPKGTSLGALDADPDRIRTPLVKRDGEFHEATWDEAFALIDARLPALRETHGPDTVAVYFGNPSAHNLSGALYLRVLAKALATRNVYSAGTVDQVPKTFVGGYLYGDAATIPVADLDRTDHLLILGANPLVSNGSLMTAPDMRGKLAAIRKRGGKVVVIDPARTRTAERADEHHPITPGTDAFLLFAMLHVILEEGLERVDGLAPHLAGLDEVRVLAKPFSPETVAERTGIAADEIRRLASELAAAERAAVYGRMGTTTVEFGTLASWLVDVLNIVTGNLDRPGGVMFPKAAAGQPNTRPRDARRPFRHGRWHSRVRELPEVMGELPVATLADEILTPGNGQVRALVTVMGNPCVSTPRAGRLDEALERLDFMVSFDVYLNETTRHADVILPGPTPLERDHYDLLLYQYAVRNVANWTPAVVQTDVPQEWETMLRLVGVLQGMGPDADVAALDAALADGIARLNGVAVTEGLAGPRRLLDVLLKAGPYDVTLADLEAAPHGLDLGPLQPRLPEVLSTASGLVELAPAAIVDDVPRLVAALDRPAAPGMVLIGRRHLRSNNSWMHNLEPLAGGGNDCSAHVHPDDAARLGLVDGGACTMTSRVGAITLPVVVTDRIRPGVVSVPHGWGHDVDGTRTEVAARRPGVNSNVLTDDTVLDVPTGTGVLNGIPVELLP
ncbi:molybdopterin oxidoreductase family protein [Nocardioides immobilis]|uniref:Molybdopterin oxidoreductase family protein n=1 Tax=Nocardioides immobilis TaxID=2049295 RepID=A0A417Y7G1_9ACTN|nr:molybdopterin-dependent oxidoreductase [Nocardioides immobilis]RHW28682.1 molybdopterin oxidoreductase family protein [Nocardioides immobilis]